MLCRISKVTRSVNHVRRLNIFDKLASDPKVQEKAAAMMQDPEAVKKSMESLVQTMKGGGGMMGMMFRNSPMKNMVDKIGGVENLERMMNDPRFMESLNAMLKDPDALARAAAQTQEMMKNKEQLPEKK